MLQYKNSRQSDRLNPFITEFVSINRLHVIATWTVWKTDFDGVALHCLLTILAYKWTVIQCLLQNDVVFSVFFFFFSFILLAGCVLELLHACFLVD